MSKKNTIRILVAAGLLAWPGVETCRYYVAKQQLAASVELKRTVTERLASLQKLNVPQTNPDVTGQVIPVSNTP